MDDISLDLLDNGSGSDMTENDGIYSRYLTDLNIGRFSLDCQINGNENTKVMKHLDESKTGIYPLTPSLTSPICCGSTSGDNFETELTGHFTRFAKIESLKVKTKQKRI